MYFEYTAALLGAVLGVAALFFGKRSFAACCFFAGMWLLAAETALDGLRIHAATTQTVVRWQSLHLAVSAFLPAAWLCFGLTYSRGNYREFLFKWRFRIAAAFLLPVTLALGLSSHLFQVAGPSEAHGEWWLKLTLLGKTFNLLLLVASVLILASLEATLHAAAGTMRWRIKFVVLGLAMIFGAHIYTYSQALLFSGQDIASGNLQTAALLIGCILIGLSYLRAGLLEIDVYLSHEVLQKSATVLIVGSYLFAVGVLSKIVVMAGGGRSFRLYAFLALLAVAALGVLLLSDRLRQGTHRFVSRHFQRPRHDFRKVWTSFTHATANVLDKVSLCEVAGKLISETFDVLSVTIWLWDEKNLAFAASTAQAEGAAARTAPSSADCELARAGLRRHDAPFDLEKTDAPWAKPLKELAPAAFPKGGNRLCLPLFAGEQWLGAGILADRVNGAPYSPDEIELLKCLADQLAANLFSLTLSQKLTQAKELEAFQTMAAFFVHDLKNAAASLNLMLRNLPLHFDDPAFRADALRGIGSAADRIRRTIERLGALGNSLHLQPVEFELHELIEETIANFNGVAPVPVSEEPGARLKVTADKGHLQSVLTNLLLNAREAAGAGGVVRVAASRRNGHVVLSVSDNGCGMSPDFIANSLFRPFRTTKKHGLGIGMFQSKVIVEAHHGRIEVESELGKGTSFHVKLPLSVP